MDFDPIRAAFLACEKGAALIYHQVLATGVHILEWETSHPAVGVLLNDGVAYSANALLRFGVPAGTVELHPNDVAAALKMLAALDASVPSVAIATTTVVSQSPVGAAAPVLADLATATASLAPATSPPVAAASAPAPVVPAMSGAPAAAP